MVRIQDWVAIRVYNQPSGLGFVLFGYVAGHPHFPAGTFLRTSPVQLVAGRYARTQHRVYQLGRPEGAFATWLQQQDPAWDPEAPLLRFCTV